MYRGKEVLAGPPDTRDQSLKSRDRRKTYHAPRLLRYGPVARLTQGTASTGVDTNHKFGGARPR